MTDRAITTLPAATVPPGYMQDAQGRLVPVDLVRPIDKLRDQTVLGLVEHAQALNAALASFKKMAFSDIAAFVATSAEQFDVAIGGEKGNVTLRSFDGRYKVERSIQEAISFDERLLAAKALIDKCLNRWTADAQPELRAVVNDAFQVDQQGRVSTWRVLGLKRIDIKDPEWLEAMEAIAQAITVTGSRSYVRLFQRVGQTDRYEPITLDLASV